MVLLLFRHNSKHLIKRKLNENFKTKKKRKLVDIIKSNVNRLKKIKYKKSN